MKDPLPAKLLWPLQTPSCLLLLLPLSFLAATYLLSGDLAFLFSPCMASLDPASHVAAQVPPLADSPFRLLIGILTLPSRHERRHLLRVAYSLQPVPGVDIRFVFCNVTDADDAVFLAMESRLHGDILVLDCAESMNSGKTFTFFSSLPSLFPSSYDFVMKTDDDAYFRLDNLVDSLRNKPAVDMYYGVGYPFDQKTAPYFMLGMGYILSWDLVEWVATSEIPRREPAGPEDYLTGKWLNDGGRAKHRYNMIPAMYDYRGPNREDFLDGTICVHQLKTREAFAKTLKHFEGADMAISLPSATSGRQSRRLP